MNKVCENDCIGLTREQLSLKYKENYFPKIDRLCDDQYIYQVNIEDGLCIGLSQIVIKPRDILAIFQKLMRDNDNLWEKNRELQEECKKGYVGVPVFVIIDKNTIKSMEITAIEKKDGHIVYTSKNELDETLEFKESDLRNTVFFSAEEAIVESWCFDEREL